MPETALAGDLVQAGVKVAPAHVAALQGLEPGAKAFLRQRVLTDEGEPVELASAWLPLDLGRRLIGHAAGTEAPEGFLRAEEEKPVIDALSWALGG